MSGPGGSSNQAHNYYWNNVQRIRERSQLQAQRRHELSLARIANPVRDRTLDGRSATPNSAFPSKSLRNNAPPTLKRKKKEKF